jgi:hypothetical protein
VVSFTPLALYPWGISKSLWTTKIFVCGQTLLEGLSVDGRIILKYIY